MLKAEEITHHFAGGTYAKAIRLPAGFGMVQHKHTYDHLSILSAGRAIVEYDGVRTEYTAPAVITIKAGKNHGIEAQTECLWFCIHATDETDIDKVDASVIQKEKT